MAGTLHEELKLVLGKPVIEGVEVVVYFSATGTAGGLAITPNWRGKVRRCTPEALVVDVNNQTIALSWDHILGLQVAG